MIEFFTNAPYMLAGAIGMISAIVLVHEYGHYLAARMLGIGVTRFSFGFGPPIWAWTARSGTQWCISMLPLGGYVRMVGDKTMTSAEGDRSEPGRENFRNFQSSPLWQKSLVITAGPATNFIAAIAAFAAVYMVTGQDRTPPVVIAVQNDSPAARAGIEPEDWIVALDGNRISTWPELRLYISNRRDQPIVATVSRAGDERTVTVTPAKGDRNQGQFGITGPDQVMSALNPASALSAGVADSWFLISEMGRFIKDFVTGSRSVDQIGGALGVASSGAAAASGGIDPFIRYFAVLSILVGLFNLLPLWQLDGALLVRYAITATTGREINGRVAHFIDAVGFASLVALVALGTFLDIMRMLND